MFARVCNFWEGEFCFCLEPESHLYILYLLLDSINAYIRQACCGRDA